ncbi:hypothetical protein N7507_002925 [Penicillium longicatenatum]|nr:hypothetical protein N7507_002925 [Penicillium longicatenatum]
MPLKHRILALVFHDFEALDLFGALGAIVPRSDYYTLKLVNVHNLPAPHGLESSLKNGIGTLPNLSIAEVLGSAEPFDTLFIPGGTGFQPLVWDPILLEQIGLLSDRAPNVFTVCTGSLILAATGRLDRRSSTTNKRLFDEMTPKWPKVKWQKQARWVQEGKFLMSSGITAGLDAALAFMAITYVAPENREAQGQEIDVTGEKTVIPGFDHGKALEFARSISWRLEYEWHEDPSNDPFV